MQVDVDGETYRPGDFAFVSYNDSGIFLRKVRTLGAFLRHPEGIARGDQNYLSRTVELNTVMVVPDQLLV